MSITYLGSLLGETVEEDWNTLSGDIGISFPLTGQAVLARELAGDIPAQFQLSAVPRKAYDLDPVNIPAQFDLNVELAILYDKLITSKLSDYTIYRVLDNHTELANDNLISQFKDCPNLLKLLNVWMVELDTLSEDVRQFQSNILNTETAEGVNLDIVGKVLGLDRILGEPDLYYRDRLLTKINVNNCDGTFRSILVALLFNYRHPLDARSKEEVQVNSRTHNRFDVYVRDFETVLNYGGVELVDSLSPAGSQANILVNRPETPLAGYFCLEGGDGQGLGASDVPELGGELVGLYNRDENSKIPEIFGLEGDPDSYGLNIGAFLSYTVTQDHATPVVLDGPVTPTTDEIISVDTFN